MRYYTSRLKRILEGNFYENQIDSSYENLKIKFYKKHGENEPKTLIIPMFRTHLERKRKNVRIFILKYKNLYKNLVYFYIYTFIVFNFKIFQFFLKVLLYRMSASRI